MKMVLKKGIVLLLAAVFALGGLVSCASYGQAESYKIGVIASQTGAYSGLGMQSLEGMDIIVDKINLAGGINGIPVELVVYDDKSSSVEAARIAKKLVDIDKVHALASGTATAMSRSLVPVANEEQVPMVMLSGTSSFDDELGAWCFRPFGSEDDYIVLLLNYLSKEVGVTKLAVLLENSGYGQGGDIFLPQRVSDYGIEIVEKQYFNPDSIDLTPQLTNIKTSDAEAIFIWGTGPAGAFAVKQARDLDIALPIVATSPQGSPDDVKAFGKYYEMEPSLVILASKIDIWEQLPDSDSDKAMCQEFESLCAERGHPATMWNIVGAQIIMLIEDGLRRGQPDLANVQEARSQLKDAIESTGNLSLFMANYTMSPTDHCGNVLPKDMLVTFKDGKKVLVS
ncbi:MAG: ABC transporter substrate-binding protein [Dehalococcoidia bacterium]|nr:ABC transporter substrate-binding protein [Dehalococcoidia bacterium]